MNVYTYYEDINFSNQNRLLELWKISWKSRGFTPIVLNREHAKQNPYYDEYVHNLNKIHKKIFGKSISNYRLCCFLRWMAYSTVSDEVMIVCDYDVINGGVDIIEYKNKYSGDKLNMLRNVCPCVSIGSPLQYDEFCKIIIDISFKNIQNIQKKIKENNSTGLHDQDFLLYNRELVEDKINMCYDKTLKCLPSEGGTGRGMLIHFSYYYTTLMIDACTSNKYDNKEVYKVRVELIEEFLKSISVL